MFLVVMLLLLSSVYIGQNKKISDGHKTGWFVFVAIFSVLTFLLELL